MFHSFLQFSSKIEVLILLFTFLHIYSVVRRDSKVNNFADSLSFVDYYEVWSYYYYYHYYKYCLLFIIIYLLYYSKRFQANKGKNQTVPRKNNYRRRLRWWYIASGKCTHPSPIHPTEYMCFNQTGDISTLKGSSLKLVDNFTYLGSSVSSTETNINMRLAKVWTAIDRVSVIWKSDLTDKLKRSFFQAAVVSILLYGCTTWMLTKRMEKNLDGNYTRMLRAILNKS